MKALLPILITFTATFLFAQNNIPVFDGIVNHEEWQMELKKQRNTELSTQKRFSNFLVLEKPLLLPKDLDKLKDKGLYLLPNAWI